MLTPFSRLLRTVGPFVCAFVSLADVWYVNSEANRLSQDGKSWSTAFTAIQLAIDAAHADDGGDVWIAKGIYNEPRSHFEDGLETGALFVRDKVSLYGGFAGNEKDFNGRDLASNTVVISGRAVHTGISAYHVIEGEGTVRLDGLVVCDGAASGENPNQQMGGGLKFWNGALTIEKCIFLNNTAKQSGAGVHVVKSSVTINESTFENNKVPKRRGSGLEQRNGGGVYVALCKDATIRGCYFVGNYCADYGGGFYSNDTVTKVMDCRFERNASGYFAGGAYFGGVASTLENCVFADNTSAMFSAGVRFGHGATGSLKKCRFERNVARLNGGAISFLNVKPCEIIGCEFIGNKGEERHGGAISAENMSLSIWDSTFEDNNAPSGAAVVAEDATVIIENSSFKGNLSGTFIQLTPKGSIALTNSRVDAAGGKLLSLMASDEHYFSLSDTQRRLTSWVNNVELKSGSR